MTTLDAEDVQCCWDRGPDPASGCVNLADGKDELCSTHRAALAGLESLGHTTARWLDTETGQWGWECEVCPAVHAAVLSFAGADLGAEKHRQETKP